MKKLQVRSLTPKTDDVSIALVGFASLEEAAQDVVLNNHKALLILRHKSRYEMGERLSRIQAILKPLRLYEIYLKTELKESRATANRAVAYYQKIQALPKPVRDVVIQRQSTLNTKRIEAFPPPETNDPEEIEEWVVLQEKGTGRTIEVSTEHRDTPETMIKQNLRDIRRNLRKMPKAKRAAYIQQLCGMALSLGNLPSQKIEPVEVPEEFFVLGRPRLLPPQN